VVRLVTKRMDLRREVLAGRCRIFVEQGLNFVVVFLEQRSDLFPLFRREFQILGQVIEFFIHRSRTMNRRARLIGILRLRYILLRHGDGRHYEREHGSESLAATVADTGHAEAVCHLERDTLLIRGLDVSKRREASPRRAPAARSGEQPSALQLLLVRGTPSRIFVKCCHFACER
jgi:hypothetical protein